MQLIDKEVYYYDRTYSTHFLLFCLNLLHVDLNTYRTSNNHLNTQPVLGSIALTKWDCFFGEKRYWRTRDLIVRIVFFSGLNLINKKLSDFWTNFQISENFLRFSNCVPIKIFWGTFSEICPASCHKIFCQKISQNSDFSW